MEPPQTYNIILAVIPVSVFQIQAALTLPFSLQADSASVVVHVVSGERPAAMQSDTTKLAPSLSLILLLSTTSQSSITLPLNTFLWYLLVPFFKLISNFNLNALKKSLCQNR